MMNFLVIYEFAEELQYSANLLSTVAPHHFIEEFVEPVEDIFSGLVQQLSQKAQFRLS
jgi:hypothetical protein